jgi:Domain of unknown function (DUF4149)
MFVLRACLLITTFWVGSLWTVGYLVAPALFISLSDQAMAGMIAGSLFRVEAWLSLLSGAVLIALEFFCVHHDDPKQKKRLVCFMIGMMACSLTGYFALHPYMSELRGIFHEVAGISQDRIAEAKRQFGILHGVSSAIYFLQSLLGAVLICGFDNKKIKHREM